MKADIEINAFDAIMLLREFYQQKLGVEIGDVTIKSWQQTVCLVCDDRISFGNGVRHTLRIEHSDLINPDGTPK